MSGYRSTILVGLGLFASGVAFALSHALPVVAPYAPVAENTAPISCGPVVSLLNSYQAKSIENNHVMSSYFEQLSLATDKYHKHYASAEGQLVEFGEGAVESARQTSLNLEESLRGLKESQENLDGFLADLLEVLPECLSLPGQVELSEEDQALIDELINYRENAKVIELGAESFLKQQLIELEALVTQIEAAEGESHKFKAGAFDYVKLLSELLAEASSLIKTSSGQVEESLFKIIEKLQKRLDNTGSLAQAL